jgi:hypothetical protein
MKKYILVTAIFLLLGTVAVAQTDEDYAWADDIRQEAEDANSEYNNMVMEDDQPDAPEAEDAPSPKRKGVVYPYRRYFELGVNADFGIANNFLGVEDLLKKELVLSKELFSKIKNNGFMLNFNVGAGTFINVNPTPKWGFDIATSVTGDVNLAIPQSLFNLLSEGNLKQYSSSGSFDVSGAVYADTGIDIHVRFLESQKLKVSVVPSMFVPLVYIPKSSVSYKVKADDEIEVTVGGGFNVYSPFSLNDFSTVDPAGILDAKGFDLTLKGEYDFFDWLTAGGAVTHIPLVPSNLNHHAYMTMEDEDGGPFTILKTDGGLLNGYGDIETPDFEPVYDNKSIKVTRPVRFDIYANYKPFGTKIVVLSPNVGLTVNTVDETPHFNFLLKAELNTAIFLLHLSTGYDELLWKHALMMGFNFRVIELDIGMNLRSQDFVESLKLGGMGLWLGVRMGF